MEQPTDQRHLWRKVRWLIWPLLYLALRLAAPFIHVPSPLLGDLIATVVFLLVPLLWIRDLSRIRIHPGVAVGLFVLLALIWGEFLLGKPLGLLHYVNWDAHPDAKRAMGLIFLPVADLALITAGALLGIALSRIITDPKMLLPVALAGAMVDFWGVYMGTTRLALQVAPDVVSSVSASIPTLGSGMKGILEPASQVGFGDWLFLGLFLAVTFRYNLRPRKTFWVLLAFLIPAMLFVLFGPVNHLPAVVPMALAVFVVNGRELKLTRQEVYATVIAIVLVGGLLFGGFALVRPYLIPPEASNPPAGQPAPAQPTQP